MDTPKDIWIDVKERFSQGNGPRISVAYLAQGNMSGSNDFTKLKALWEELQNYKMSPMCSFGAGKSMFWISSRRICTAIADATE